MYRKKKITRNLEHKNTAETKTNTMLNQD